MSQVAGPPRYLEAAEPRESGEAGILAAYRVLDFTDESGWLCGRILGDLGADVVKVEPPGGDPGRRLGLLTADAEDAARAGDPGARDPGVQDTRARGVTAQGVSWLAYNANKRSVTLSLETTRGQELARWLAQRADFLIESHPPGYLEARGLGFTALRERNPRLIHTSITPFGQTGPYAGYHGSDIVAMAMGGLMSLVGEPGRPPLRVSLPQAAMWTGMYAAAGTLIAHHYRQRTGCGQHVDVSMQAGLLWALAIAPAHWSLMREDLHRSGNAIVGRSVTGARMRAIYRCRDGYLNFIIYGGEAGQRSNEAMVRWMSESRDVPEWLRRKDWAAFNVATSTQEEIDAIERPIAEFLAGCTKAEFTAESLKRGILGYPVADARDIRQDPQLEARGFWQEVDHPALGGTVSYPGAFARFSASFCGIRRRAPTVGEHNEEIYERELGLSRQELEVLRKERAI